jgi:hypothetical protein
MSGATLQPTFECLSHIPDILCRIEDYFRRFEVLSAVTTRKNIFWDVRPYSLVEIRGKLQQSSPLQQGASPEKVSLLIRSCPFFHLLSRYLRFVFWVT